MSKVQGGLSLLIPYVQAFKNNNSGQSQNISLQFDAGNGGSLMKVYHAPYNSQQYDTLYDHCNANNVPTVAKTVIYYTQLNGKRTQDININCASNANPPFLDYMSHEKQLKGSIIQNANIYQYNWHHCDDFSDISRQDNNGDLISGIPMSIAPLTWSFVGVQTKNINLNLHLVCVH